MVDPNEPRGTLPLRTLMALSTDSVDEQLRRYYILANALILDREVFTETLKMSRFWQPVILNIVGGEKPILGYIPAVSNTELHKKNFKSLVDDLRSRSVDFEFRANPPAGQWDLYIDRSAYAIFFRSWQILDKHFTPPTINFSDASVQPSVAP